jgi:hypothetical protein
VREGEIGVGHSASSDGGHTCPGCVDVESVGVAVAHEIVECRGLQTSGSTVGFYHHHLVAVMGVDVVVFNIGNR